MDDEKKASIEIYARNFNYDELYYHYNPEKLNKIEGKVLDYLEGRKLRNLSPIIIRTPQEFKVIAPKVVKKKKEIKK